MVRKFEFFILAVLLGFTGRAPAHDLKALASQLHLTPKEDKITVFLSWGHTLPVDDLIDGETIDQFDFVDPDGNSTALKKSEMSLQANAVKVGKAGIYQVLVKRKPSVLTYVYDSEGNRVMKRGPKSKITEGKIDYGFRSQQFAKAVIVKGPAGPAKVELFGLPLEILPLGISDSWRKGTAIQFQVTLHGKPLPSEQVLATHIGFRPAGAWCYAANTDKQGVVTILPQQTGTWVLRVNLKKPAAAAQQNEYDYESFTSTLALEILP